MNTVKIKSASKAKGKSPYHHGDLRKQLIAAAEEIILERGVDGFTLREAARRAGVSPAAPAHHFKDARGLLSEVALQGFQEFGDALIAADKRGGTDPQKRLQEQGLAYVTFALKNPARFQLMFAPGKCDMGYKNLAEVADRSFNVLESAVRAASGLKPTDEMTEDGYGLLMAMWSIVHGFAHLALGGQFDRPSKLRGGKNAILKSFLPLTLKHIPTRK
ncbi:MAG: TetR/AcrR family transcriptional regulator [Rhizomicrobium sp.]